MIFCLPYCLRKETGEFLKWLSEERVSCYGDEKITIRAKSDNSVLFVGFLDEFKFKIDLSVSDYLGNSNPIVCLLPGIKIHRIFPSNILDIMLKESKGRINYVSMFNEYHDEDFELYDFIDSTDAVLFTAELFKVFTDNEYDECTNIKRRKPPYPLLQNEKTQGMGYAGNIYLHPLKQLFAACCENIQANELLFEDNKFYYEIENYIKNGKLFYPDGRIKIYKECDQQIRNEIQLFSTKVLLRDCMYIGGYQFWFVFSCLKVYKEYSTDIEILFSFDDTNFYSFKGKCIRHSKLRTDKSKGYIIYFQLQGKFTLSYETKTTVHDIDLYNEDCCIEDIIKGACKHPILTFVDEFICPRPYLSSKVIKSTIKLNDLVGMKKVKMVFNEFEQFGKYKYLLNAKENRKDDLNDLKLLYNYNQILQNNDKDSLSFHMAFLGSPGTGKTTVAERVALLLKSYNLIVTKEKPIIATKSDLVGKFIGHTEEIVKNIIQEALGGVLFVDEAHTLFEQGSINDFGHIALNEIMYAMEKYKDYLVVIFAGYTREMLQMINNINPGLLSRITWYFYFDDYTAEEMWDILNLKIITSGFKIEEENLINIQEYTTNIFKILSKKFDNVVEEGKLKYLFGNGRGVRKFFMYMQIGLAVRLGDSCSDTNYNIFTLKDIDYAYNVFLEGAGKFKNMSEFKNKVGFFT